MLTEIKNMGINGINTENPKMRLVVDVRDLNMHRVSLLKRFN